MRKSILLLYALLCGVLSAENISQLKVQQMIKEIQSAPESERFEKMNQFKTILRSMNKENRDHAISELMQSKHPISSPVENVSNDKISNKPQHSTDQQKMTKPMPSNNTHPVFDKSRPIQTEHLKSKPQPQYKPKPKPHVTPDMRTRKLSQLFKGDQKQGVTAQS